MRALRKIWRRGYFLLNRQRLDRELAEEMETHREMMPPEKRAGFGNGTRLREESRDQWSWAWLEQLGQDLQYGVRTLWHAPAFTLGAVVILSLGVGVNLAEFQMFDAMIFHRFNIRDADTFIQFSRVSKDGTHLGFPSAAVESYLRESTSFEWLASEDTSFNMVVEDQSGVRTSFVSPNFFNSLGLVPAWGRLFDSHDDEPGAPAVAVLGYEEWQNRFGSNPAAIGRTVHVNGKLVIIAGVAPYTFEGLTPRRTAYWFPVAARAWLIPGSLPLGQDFSRQSSALFGKLKPGVEQAAADAELTSLTRELIARQPHAFQPDDRIQGQLVQASIRRRVGVAPAVAIFVSMVLLVLLSACANLGNMLLARGISRQREITIRMSLGASRSRVVRQLMTENFLLAALGAAAGLALGVITARVLMRMLGAPPGMQLLLSWPILAAAVALTSLSAIAFGLPAALQSSRPNARKAHLRQSLVAAQVAISCLLLIVSGVLAHNGIQSAAIDLAFDYQKMIVVDPQFYIRSMPPAVAMQKLDALSASLSGLPGVTGVAATVVPPLGGRVLFENVPGLPRIYRNAVSPSYFDCMNLHFLRGRNFLRGEPNAMIVSESAARAAWPNEDPIGKTLTIGGVALAVTGVVKDSGANLIGGNLTGEPDSVEVYMPVAGADLSRAALILHTANDPAQLIRLIPTAAAAVDETVSVELMRTARNNYIDGQRRLVTLIGSIGAVATALAAAGMFALVAFAVAQRKRELGIRMAVGAQPRHIIGLLLTQNVRPAGIGIVIGIVVAVLVSRLVRSLIFLQTRDAVDVLGFSWGIACFLAVAAVATLAPASRALRIDPSVTLREE